MEFIMFLSKLDKEILDLLIKANYTVEENRKECLLNKEIKGLHNLAENKIIICTENAKQKTNYRYIRNYSDRENFKTERAIRRALRHEATHVIQKCNNNKTIKDIKDLEKKINKNKKKAIAFSISKFAGSYPKEIEAYFMEDRAREVKKMIKKYCL